MTVSSAESAVSPTSSAVEKTLQSFIWSDGLFTLADDRLLGITVLVKAVRLVEINWGSDDHEMNVALEAMSKRDIVCSAIRILSRR
jgi:hypothetical protein